MSISNSCLVKLKTAIWLVSHHTTLNELSAIPPRCAHFLGRATQITLQLHPNARTPGKRWFYVWFLVVHIKESTSKINISVLGLFCQNGFWFYAVNAVTKLHPCGLRCHLMANVWIYIYIYIYIYISAKWLNKYIYTHVFIFLFYSKLQT